MFYEAYTDKATVMEDTGNINAAFEKFDIIDKTKVEVTHVVEHADGDTVTPVAAPSKTLNMSDTTTWDITGCAGNIPAQK